PRRGGSAPRRASAAASLAALRRLPRLLLLLFGLVLFLVVVLLFLVLLVVVHVLGLFLVLLVVVLVLVALVVVADDLAFLDLTAPGAGLLLVHLHVRLEALEVRARRALDEAQAAAELLDRPVGVDVEVELDAREALGQIV